MTDSDLQGGDARRTALAAERTWLAWWRTGVAVGAVGLAIGRFLPTLTHGAHWPFRVVGIGYGVLAVLTLVVGAQRQRRGAAALREGRFDDLGGPLVLWLTAGAVALTVGSTLLVVTAL